MREEIRNYAHEVAQTGGIDLLEKVTLPFPKVEPNHIVVKARVVFPRPPTIALTDGTRLSGEVSTSSIPTSGEYTNIVTHTMVSR